VLLFSGESDKRFILKRAFDFCLKEFNFFFRGGGLAALIYDISRN
jgi:hypothetical protein